MQRVRIGLGMALVASLFGQDEPAVSPRATVGRLLERVGVLMRTLGSIRKASDLKGQFARLPVALNAAGIVMRESGAGTEVRIGVKRVAVGSGVWWKRLEDSSGERWLELLEFPDAEKCGQVFDERQQPHTGTNGPDHFAFITAQAPAGSGAVVAGVRHGRYLISVGASVGFGIRLWDDPGNTPQELRELDEAVDAVARTLEVVTRTVAEPGYVTWIPKAVPSEQDVQMQRIASLARLWAEVKYNFVFLAARPELDWERVLELYLPRVMAARSDEEYAQALQEAVALLRDGHTGVQAGGAVDRPALWIEPVEGLPVVTALADTPAMKASGIKPGMELTAVDGIEVRELLPRIYPTVAASTKQSRDATAYWRLLEGPPQSRVKATFRDVDGATLSVELVRDQGSHPAEALPWRRPSFEYRELPGGIAYVALSSFSTATVVKRFDEHFEKIVRAPGLIIDVRSNGGGSSGNGYQIFARLIETGVKVKTTAWKTRSYKPAHRAWGREEEWFEGDHGEIEARGETPYRGPVAVLIGTNTFSAAEDFLAPVKQSKRGVVIGSPSGGSTGQPLSVVLFQASARICTKWDRFADGTEFVGVGVQPDIRVEPTRRDVAAGRDVVLERALEVLGKGAK